MPIFKWIDFFEERGIHYVTSGPNVSRGHCAIKCPLCGEGDQSEHMSVSLTSDGWRCWRNPTEHAGLKPHRLLIALGLSPAAAAALVGYQAPPVQVDFLSQVQGMLEPAAPIVQQLFVLVEPKEFRLLDRLTVASRLYVNYLLNRQLGLPDVQSFGLRYAISGEFAGRILFMVYGTDGQLMGWTGRAISKQNLLRYKDEGHIKDYLWRQDELLKVGGDTLVVCEGPFDALKVCVLGKALGITATCVFTSAPSAAQLLVLRSLKSAFRRIVVVFDVGNEPAALRLSGTLPFVNFVFLPVGVKDPAELLDLRFLLEKSGPA